MNINRIGSPVLSALLLLSFLACNGNNTYFTAYEHLENSLWYRSDTTVLPIIEPSINVDIAESDTIHVYIGIRYTESYKYDNLVLLAKLTENDTTTVWTDTLRFSTTLSNKKGFHFREAIQPTLPMPYPTEGQKYSLRISHLMTLDPLEGISDIMAFGEP